MHSKKKHSGRFTRTKRSSNTRKKNQRGGVRRPNILVEITPGSWQTARLYQKQAFRNFLAQYASDFNPDNVYHYDKDNIRFQVLGEIYIVREDGSRMRIKSVQVPDDAPEPDFDNEAPGGTDNKYYFVASDGASNGASNVNYYFNNRINQEIETNKTTSKEFTVGSGLYKVVLDPAEIQVPSKATKKVGTLQAGGYTYQLFYDFIPGHQHFNPY